jgi:surfactin synthase thioesterase subunit
MTMVVRTLRRDAAFRLFCLPYAGGSAQTFRDWPRHVPADLEIVALELGGRGTRFSEPPQTRLEPIVAEAVETIGAAADRPFALFGHSMGALAAVEIARALDGTRDLRHLFVSAHRPPDAAPIAPAVHRLPDGELLDHLRRLDEASPALRDADLMRVMLPVVRADLTACETYVHRPRPPLTCALTAFGGDDDPLVSRDALEGWRAHTGAAFRLEMFRGGHFYFNTCLVPLLNSIIADLGRTGAVDRVRCTP